MTLDAVMVILGAFQVVFGVGMLVWALRSRAASWWRAYALLWLAMGIEFLVPRLVPKGRLQLSLIMLLLIVGLSAFATMLKLLRHTPHTPHTPHAPHAPHKRDAR